MIFLVILRPNYLKYVDSGECPILPHSGDSYILLSIQTFEVNFIPFLFGGRWCFFQFLCYSCTLKIIEVSPLPSLVQWDNAFTLLKINSCGVSLYYLILILTSTSPTFFSYPASPLPMGAVFYLGISSNLPHQYPLKAYGAELAEMEDFLFIIFFENRLILHNIYLLWFALHLLLPVSSHQPFYLAPSSFGLSLKNKQASRRKQ